MHRRRLLAVLPFIFLIAPSYGRASDAVTVGNLTITISYLGMPSDVSHDDIREWVDRSAKIVRGYLGEFSVRSVALEVNTVEGASMGSGRTSPYPQPHIQVTVGRRTSRASLEQDWVLVHEMIHLSLPGVAHEQNWFAEGVAVYVEGVARVQSGNLSAAALWEEFVKDMPKGLPQDDDHGLDQTHTWARTYWGGALYCLVADVRIRELTHNRRGLEDALRAVAHAGTGIADGWSIQRILTAGDAATGTKVLSELYDAMKDHPVAPDLDGLWTSLGIQKSDGQIQFNDTARLAAVREAITSATDNINARN